MKICRVFFALFMLISLSLSSTGYPENPRVPLKKPPRAKFPPMYRELEPVEDDEPEVVESVPQKSSESKPSSFASKVVLPAVAVVVGGVVVWRVTKVDYPPKTLQFVVVSRGGNIYNMQIDPPASSDPVVFLVNSDKIYSPGFENPVAGEYRFTTIDYTVLPTRVVVQAYVDGIQVNSIELSGDPLTGVMTITEANVAND